MSDVNQAAIDLLDKWLLSEPPADVQTYRDPYVWIGTLWSRGPLYLLPTLFYDPPESVASVIGCPDYRVTLCWLRFAVSVGVKVSVIVRPQEPQQ